MAAPVVPFLKKLATAIFSDKKAWKTILCVVLGILFLFMLPFIVLMGMLKNIGNVDKDKMEQVVIERQESGAEVMAKIEEAMESAGFESRAKEAQSLYLLALYEKRNEENFVANLVGCFAEEQTDEQLIAAVNAAFGTAINYAEFTIAMQEVRNNQ